MTSSPTLASIIAMVICASGFVTVSDLKSRTLRVASPLVVSCFAFCETRAALLVSALMPAALWPSDMDSGSALATPASLASFVAQVHARQWSASENQTTYLGCWPNERIRPALPPPCVFSPFCSLLPTSSNRKLWLERPFSDPSAPALS
jgi:hypothetical protein